jgi:hypothetical protein
MEKGYNVVAMPKATLAPLQLLAKEGKDLSALGNEIADLFDEDREMMPAIYENEPLEELQGQSQLIFQADSGFQLLKNLLAQLNLGKLEAKAEFKDSDTLVFSFHHAKEDGIKKFLDLDNYISGGIPKVEHFKTYKQKLEKSELFVITSVLKCKEFSIKVLDQNNQNASATFEVQGGTSANASIKREQDSSLHISYQGDKDLVFAFKAVQIFYDKPKWFEFWNSKEAHFTIKPQVGYTLKSVEDFPVNYLDGEGELVEV